MKKLEVLKALREDALIIAYENRNTEIEEKYLRKAYELEKEIEQLENDE